MLSSAQPSAADKIFNGPCRFRSRPQQFQKGNSRLENRLQEFQLQLHNTCRPLLLTTSKMYRAVEVIISEQVPRISLLSWPNGYNYNGGVANPMICLAPCSFSSQEARVHRGHKQSLTSLKSNDLTLHHSALHS